MIYAIKPTLLALTLFIGMGACWAEGESEEDSNQGGTHAKRTPFVDPFKDSSLSSEIRVSPASEDALLPMMTTLLSRKLVMPLQQGTDLIDLGVHFYTFQKYPQGLELIQLGLREGLAEGAETWTTRKEYWRGRYYEAYGLLKKGKQDQGLKVYEDILSSEAAEDMVKAAAATGFLNVGKDHYATLNYPEGVEVYRRASELRLGNSFHDSAVYHLAYGLQHAGEATEALATYDRLISETTSKSFKALAHFKKGMVYFHDHRWEDAKDNLFETISYKGWNPYYEAASRHFLAEALVNVHPERAKESIDYYYEALRIPEWKGRDRARTLKNVGHLLYLTENYPAALAHYESALKTKELDDKEQAIILRRMGYLHAKNGHVEKAFTAWLAASLEGVLPEREQQRMMARWGEILFRLGEQTKNVRERKKFYTDAEPKLLEALKGSHLTSDEHLATQFYLVRTYVWLAKEKIDAAIPILREILKKRKEKSSERGFALYLLAVCHTLHQKNKNGFAPLKLQYEAYINGRDNMLETIVEVLEEEEKGGLNLVRLGSRPSHQGGYTPEIGGPAVLVNLY